jgi:hypothetical protein
MRSFWHKIRIKICNKNQEKSEKVFEEKKDLPGKSF